MFKKPAAIVHLRICKNGWKVQLFSSYLICFDLRAEALYKCSITVSYNFYHDCDSEISILQSTEAADEPYIQTSDAEKNRGQIDNTGQTDNIGQTDNRGQTTEDKKQQWTDKRGQTDSTETTKDKQTTEDKHTIEDRQQRTNRQQRIDNRGQKTEDRQQRTDTTGKHVTEGNIKAFP